MKSTNLVIVGLWYFIATLAVQFILATFIDSITGWEVDTSSGSPGLFATSNAANAIAWLLAILLIFNFKLIFIGRLLWQILKKKV